MKQLAAEVWRLDQRPRPIINVYLVGDVLIDAGRRQDHVREIAGFRVIHAPGHSPGEVIYFRESDRVAICGDVIRSMSYATLRPRILEPPDAFNDDTAQNRESIRKLAELEPAVILPGHGPAVTDRAAFAAFVSGLPGQPDFRSCLYKQ
jgi:glyoxylase-like metal-dependent hydrolase (beta-lactamase superfamily II)